MTTLPPVIVPVASLSSLRFVFLFPFLCVLHGLGGFRPVSGSSEHKLTQARVLG